jgi:hypothetical protein
MTWLLAIATEFLAGERNAASLPAMTGTSS